MFVEVKPRLTGPAPVVYFYLLTYMDKRQDGVRERKGGKSTRCAPQSWANGKERDGGADGQRASDVLSKMLFRRSCEAAYRGRRVLGDRMAMEWHPVHPAHGDSSCVCLWRLWFVTSLSAQHQSHHPSYPTMYVCTYMDSTWTGSHLAKMLAHCNL